MILDVIFCALWCVGILALVWGLAGWLLLPLSGRQSTVLFPDGKEGALERQLRTNAWLRAAWSMSFATGYPHRRGRRRSFLRGTETIFAF